MFLNGIYDLQTTNVYKFVPYGNSPRSRRGPCLMGPCPHTACVLILPCLRVEDSALKTGA